MLQMWLSILSECGFVQREWERVCGNSAWVRTRARAWKGAVHCPLSDRHKAGLIFKPLELNECPNGKGRVAQVYVAVGRGAVSVYTSSHICICWSSLPQKETVPVTSLSSIFYEADTLPGIEARSQGEMSEREVLKKVTITKQLIQGVPSHGGSCQGQ